MPPLLISDPEFEKITLYDNKEALFDVRTSKIVLVAPIPEYEAMLDDYAFVRTGVYERLCKVATSLPQGIRLMLLEGFRSLRVQGELFESFRKISRSRLGEEASETDVFLATTRLVSPLKHLDGRINTPPHSTGGAVDVTLVDESGKHLDMGMHPFDWQECPPEICVTACSDISVEAQKNRRILLDAMLAAGFVNYPYEFWHFSFGDRYWAHYSGKTASLYGPI